MNLLEITLEQLKTEDYEDSLNNILRHEDCPHVIKVKFAYYCANDYFLTTNWEGKEEIKELSQHCLELIEKWLDDNSSVSKEELEQASSNHIQAKYSATNCVRWAAEVINATKSKNRSAHWAINAAYWSTKSIKNKKQTYKKYVKHLIDLILEDYKICNSENLRITV